MNGVLGHASVCPCLFSLEYWISGIRVRQEAIGQILSAVGQ